MAAACSGGSGSGEEAAVWGAAAPGNGWAMSGASVAAVGLGFSANAGLRLCVP